MKLGNLDLIVNTKKSGHFFLKVAFWFHDFLKIFLLFKNYWFLKYVYIIRSPNKRTTPPQSPPTPHKIGKKWFIIEKRDFIFKLCEKKCALLSNFLGSYFNYDKCLLPKQIVA